MINNLRRSSLYRHIALKFKSSDAITHAYSFLFQGSDNKSIISRRSDLCIDGPMRCANHYMLEIMSKYYPTLSIAHHYHSPGSIKLGIRFNIPSILVIRDPIDQISSSKVYLPNIGIDQLIFEYLHFLLSLSSYHKKIIVSDFSRTINNPISIVNEIQGRFKIFPKNKKIEMNDKDFIEAVTKRKEVLASQPSRSPFPSEWREFEKSYVKDKVVAKLKDTSRGKKLSETYKFFQEISLKSEDIYK